MEAKWTPTLPWHVEHHPAGPVLIVEANGGTVADVYRSQAVPLLQAAPTLAALLGKLMDALDECKHYGGFDATGTCKYCELSRESRAVLRGLEVKS